MQSSAVGIVEFLHSAKGILFRPCRFAGPFGVGRSSPPRTLVDSQRSRHSGRLRVGKRHGSMLAVCSGTSKRCVFEERFGSVIVIADSLLKTVGLTAPKDFEEFLGRSV